MSRTREYYKMRDYNKMKAMTEEYCAKGIGAVETNQKMLEKFGDSTPTICTIYKWRRDFLDRKRGHDDEEGGGGKINVLDDVQQKLAKIPRKVSLEKYCADCNRDLCTRQYYELHMLKLHNILVGDSKPAIEYLDELAPSRTQHIIFRCDACFGGALDYDTIEEWQQHKLLEHGQQMRMPKWCSTIAAAKSSKVKSPPPPSKMSLQNVKSSMSPPAPAAAATIPPKYTNVMIIRRDQSLPASSFLRRSNRVPKPISRLNYLLLAKDDNDEIEESGGEKEERKNTPKEFSKKVRHVNFMEGTKDGSSTNEGSSKMEGNTKEKSAAVHAKQQQREEVNVNGEVNGRIGGFSKEEKVEIVIKEKAVEKVQIRIQKPPQENPPQVNNKAHELFTPPPKRVRLLSTDTLDAATTLLKLTFGSTINLTDDDILLEEQNSPTIVNECSEVGAVETIKTTTTTTTGGTTSTSISSNLPHSPPPTVSTSNNSVSIQPQSIPEAKLMPIESTNLKSPPTTPLHLPLSQQPNISSGLSNTAELAAELDKAAEERKAAERRIQALKNIQWLFDQAMLQFQQYLAAMPTSTINNGNGQINGIQQDECAISNLVPSSSSMNLGTSSSTTSSSMPMPTAIQNGNNPSSSMATTKTNNK